MSNRLSLFISVFVVALVVSVSLVQIFTENTSDRTSFSLGAGAADFASSISIHTISPSDDAFIEGGVGQNSTLLKAPSGSRDAYLKFSVPRIPGAVSNATLYLTKMSDVGEGTITVSLGAHSNWTEDTLSSDSAPGAILEVGSLAGVFENSKTYAIDIGGITGDGIYTLILGVEQGGDDIWFSSSEDPTGAYRPQLEIVTRGK